MSQPENPFKIARIFGQTKIVNKYEIYLDGILGEPEDYREEFELIRNMDTEDIVTLHYNGLGGNAFTMIQFLRCFQECRGTIVGSVEGECQSAYTFMFLASDMFEVSEHVKFMVHNYNTGMYGEGHQLIAEMAFDVPWAETIMRDSYFGFLSDQEVTLMLGGKIYYFDAEEILKRCQVMVDMREERQVAELEALESKELEAIEDAAADEPPTELEVALCDIKPSDLNAEVASDE